MMAHKFVLKVVTVPPETGATKKATFLYTCIIYAIHKNNLMRFLALDIILFLKRDLGDVNKR